MANSAFLPTDSLPPPRPATPAQVAEELKGYRANLGQSREKLEEEIGNIKEAKTNIGGELEEALKGFVEAELTEVSGASFDRFSNMTAEVADSLTDLGEKKVDPNSLAYAKPLTIVRKGMIDTRNAALGVINAKYNETLDAEGFGQKLEAAAANGRELAGTSRDADGAKSAAARELSQWKQTAEYKFVELNKEVVASGAPELSAANRSYYMPQGVFARTSGWATKGAMYNKVRDALNAYGQGEGGKDIFADIADHQTKTARLEQAVTDSTAAAETAQQAATQANTEVQTLNRSAKAIKTDAEILGVLREHALGFFVTEELYPAAVKEYGEDFPRRAPLLFAKVKTLNTLQDSAEGKLDELKASVAEVDRQYGQVIRFPRPMSAEQFDVWHRRNQATVIEYDGYATSAQYSRNNTVVYVYDDSAYASAMLASTMMVALEVALISSALNHPYSSYSARMFDVGPNQADQYGLSASSFEAPPEVAQQMEALGVSNYEPGKFTDEDYSGGGDAEGGTPDPMDSFNFDDTYREGSVQAVGGGDYGGGGETAEQEESASRGGDYGGGGETAEQEESANRDGDYGSGGSRREEPEEDEPEEHGGGGGDEGGSDGEEESITSSVAAEPIAVRGKFRPRFQGPAQQL